MNENIDNEIEINNDNENENENENEINNDNEIDNENYDEDFDPNYFQCPKCDSEFVNNDHDYQYCITCIRGYCRNCSSICDTCNEKKCFRCISYLECCNRNTCQDCGEWYCGDCQYDHCSNCEKMYICKNCDQNTCQISKDHFLNEYFTVCSNDLCVMCDYPSNISKYCFDCLLDIENILEIKNIPFGVLDNIIDYLEPEFRESLNQYLIDNEGEI